MIDARTITSALGGRWVGSYGLARCPAHDDRTPSLSVTVKNDRLLVHCHTGCPQDAVLAALRTRGLWEGDGAAHEPSAAERARWRRQAKEEVVRRIARARRLWSETVPAEGTVVENYLRSRAITLPVPACLRFHPGLKHPDSAEPFPAMVAAVFKGATPELVAVHRSFLARDGSGKAPINGDVKLSLGPIMGGAVRLAAHRGRLALAEGIETALSVMEASGIPAWSTLTAGGLEGLVLPPPDTLPEVIIFADNDASGRGQRAADTAAARWAAEGRSVRVALPPNVGTDFNDILRGAA